MIAPLPLALAVSLAFTTPPPSGDPPQLAAATELLAEGKHYDALDEAELGLEYAPDHVGLLVMAARAAEAANDGDLALWYAGLAMAQAGDAKEHADAVEELALIVAELDPLEGAAGRLFDAYAADVLEVGQSLYKSKLYLNAVDMYSRCDDTVVAVKAREQLERVYDNKKAVEALLDSGADVPIEPPRRKSAAWIAKHDREHAEFENAAEFEGKNYTVITNMGYELGTQMLNAMEQVNGNYREVFQYKERGGNMARCKLYVYRTRAQYFEAYADLDIEDTAGFFMPGANYVASFDPRTNEHPGTIDDLWETLFHEASHQFTRAVSKNPIPSWLNEGTASYFEGSRLLPNGSLRTNLIPEGRLRWCKHALDEGEPSLRAVVEFDDPGSYPGDFYPVGWGLVYFMHNWEDEESERAYIPIYRDYLDSYKSGGKHDRLERFVEYFVEKAKMPGVETFEDFQARFEAWIGELHEVYFGPSEKADVLLERAARQLGHKRYEAAVESYRWALDKRPRDARAYFGLAEVLEKLGKKDAAILNYRRTLEIARDAADPNMPLPNFDQTAAELAAVCLERITKLDRVLGGRMTDADAEFATRALEVAAGYRDAEFAKTSLQLISDCIYLLGGDRGLHTMMDEITEDTGYDLRRWRRLPVEAGFEGWWADESEWAVATAGELRGDVEGLTYATYTGELPDYYLFETQITIEERRGDLPLIGLIYRPRAPRGAELMLVGPDHGVLAARFPKDDDTGIDFVKPLDVLRGDARETFKLGVRYFEGGAELFVDERSRAVMEFPPGEPRGNPTFLIQNARVAFWDVRVLY